MQKAKIIGVPMDLGAGRRGVDCNIAMLLWKICLFCYLFFVFALTSEAGNNRWTLTGPPGAQLFSFAFHPAHKNVIFGLSTNGLYRSVDTGRTWKRLGIDVFFEFNQGVLRIPTQTPQRIILFGEGVFESTNLGKTWQAVTQETHVFHDAEIHPDLPDVIYGVAREEGILKSTNGGKTWRRMTRGFEPGFFEQQLEIDPANPEVLFASNGTRIFKTTDGGNSWKRSSAGIPNPTSFLFLGPLLINPKNPNVLYTAGFAGVFKSTNGGGQWTSLDCRCFSDAFNMVIDTRNTDVLYLSFDGIVKTTDGGNTFQHLDIPAGEGGFPPPGIGISPQSSQVVFAGGTTSVHKSTDSGKTWKTTNRGLDRLRVFSTSLTPDRPDQIFAVADATYISRNGGRSWQKIDQLLQTFITSVHVSPPDPDRAIAIGQTDFLVSTDAGRQWVKKEAPLLDDFSNPQRVAFDSSDPNTIFIVSSDDIAKTTDLGNTWTQLNSGINKPITIRSVRNSQTIFVGTARGFFFRSTNNGVSWIKSEVGRTGRGEDLYLIEVDPTNSQIVYTAKTRFGSLDPGLFVSTDGGQTWVLRNRKDAGAIAALVVDPSNSETLFAVENDVRRDRRAALVSPDRGKTLRQFDLKGLPPQNIVFDVSINPSEPPTLLLTSDQGLFTYTRKVLAAGPAIAAISKLAGKVGDSITIQGKNFGVQQEDSSVTLGSAAATVNSWSDEEIEIEIPAVASTGPLSVTVAKRQSNSFEFVILPSSGKIEPVSGDSAGGTLVALLGPPGLSAIGFNVIFGNELARDVGFVPPNIVTCRTPRGTGTVEVRILTNVASVLIGSFSYE